MIIEDKGGWRERRFLLRCLEAGRRLFQRAAATVQSSATSKFSNRPHIVVGKEAVVPTFPCQHRRPCHLVTKTTR